MITVPVVSLFRSGQAKSLALTSLALDAMGATRVLTEARRREAWRTEVDFRRFLADLQEPEVLS